MNIQGLPQSMPLLLLEIQTKGASRTERPYMFVESVRFSIEYLSTYSAD
jgi:hypothetical protein